MRLSPVYISRDVVTTVYCSYHQWRMNVTAVLFQRKPRYLSLRPIKVPGYVLL